MTRKISIVAILVAGCLASGVLAFIFMERHWDQVARRLAEGMARDMAAIVDLYEASSSSEDIARLVELGRNRFGLAVTVLPLGPLPVPQPKPFFDLLDRSLADELRASVRRPFWIDTVGQSRHVEVRIKLERATCASSPRAGRPTPPTPTSS
jgi:two-component system osmolarity sensor histidine kinase EnvZ